MVTKILERWSHLRGQFSSMLLSATKTSLLLGWRKLLTALSLSAWGSFLYNVKQGGGRNPISAFNKYPGYVYQGTCSIYVERVQCIIWYWHLWQKIGVYSILVVRCTAQHLSLTDTYGIIYALIMCMCAYILTDLCFSTEKRPFFRFLYRSYIAHTDQRIVLIILQGFFY